MKRHSLLSSLLLSVVLIFSACSNARYGSRMVRVKADKIVKEERKKPLRATVNDLAINEAKTVIAKESKSSNGVYQRSKAINNAVSDAPSSNNEAFTSKATFKLADEEIRNDIPQNSLSMTQTLAAAKTTNKQIKNALKEIKKKSAKANSDRGLIMTLLIVILVLIIINLILDILPGFVSAILSVVLLVILILWLLQML